jgi:hypothetical protein
MILMNDEEVIIDTVTKEDLTELKAIEQSIIESEQDSEEEPTKYNDLGELVPVKTPARSGGGFHVDSRQQVCWDYYVETVMVGQPNIYQSALKAGYTESSAECVHKAKWFKDRKKKFKRSTMLSQAEKNLLNILKMPYMVQKQKNGEPYMEVDTDVLRIIVDVSKAVVKSLGKDEGYSDRSEVTGKGGEPIVFMPPALLDKYKLDQ